MLRSKWAIISTRWDLTDEVNLRRCPMRMVSTYPVTSITHPQYNGVAERKNWSIMDITWCTCWVTYNLMNFGLKSMIVLPICQIGVQQWVFFDKTLHDETWNGFKSSIAYLKVFCNLPIFNISKGDKIFKYVFFFFFCYDQTSKE